MPSALRLTASMARAASASCSSDEDNQDQQDWAAQGHGRRGQMARTGHRRRTHRPRPALGRSIPAPGPSCRTSPHQTARLQRRITEPPGRSPGFTRYAAAWDGFIEIPVDGGYTFHLMSTVTARDLSSTACRWRKPAHRSPRFAARPATRCATIKAPSACAPAATPCT